MSTLHQLTVHEARQKLSKKEIGVVDLARSVADRIEAVEGNVGAFVTQTKELAIKRAEELDQQGYDASKWLWGIPLAPKDIFLTQGIQTTCSSKILEGYLPPYNGTVIQKCLDHQAIIVGKTNMDEFAMGSSCETSYYKKTKNPWDLERVPGGSSGGSSAAVAADMCLASLGTDTGGSIRQPAAHCGIVGLKPTYGRVSRYGVIAFASSLDQVGPMTKDVEDAAIMMNVIAGHDPKDSTSIDCGVPDYTSFLNQSVKGKKIGVPKEYFVSGMEESVKSGVQQAMKKLQELGAEIVDVSLPHTEYGVAAYYILAPAEASSNLARYDGVRFGFRAKDAANLEELYVQTKTQGFGDEVKRRILLGTYALSAGYYDAYYRQAQKVRTLIRQDFSDAFKICDVLLAPTTPTTAFKIDEKVGDPIQMYLSDVCTIPVNLAGLPSMSLPCGFDSKGLPIGFQLIGKPFDEGSIFQVAHAYEQSATWHQQKPAL